MYKLNEFRSKTREAFNAAEAGSVVIIERHSIHYKLEKADIPNKAVSVGSVVDSPPASDDVLAEPATELCPGHERFRRNCGKKGCEYEI